jgi:hypothetical protein
MRAPEGSIAPREVERFFGTLLNQDELRKYGPVYVSVVSRSDSVDEIMLGLQLKRLSIQIHMPNPDDHGALEREIRRRLRNQKAASVTEELRAAPGKALEPDKQTRLLAEVATTNGEVTAVGKDENGVNVTRSTKSFPAVETVSYDTDSVSNEQAFLRAARSFRVPR